jgi:hypothetical protein
MNMTSRRWVLSGLLGLAGAAWFGLAAGSAAATEGEALAEGTTQALDRAGVAFSQRPQLHYNRKRQLRRQPHSQPSRPPRWRFRRSRRSLRSARPPRSP